MRKIINVGKVTAYADAVVGGYTGTREEWEEALAGIGSEAAAALEAKNAAEAAQTAAETAQSAAEAAAGAAGTAASAAAGAASDAHIDALAATAAKEAAETAQLLAEDAKASAVAAKGAAETAQGKAEDAQEAAEAAQTAAETAASAASTSAEGAALSEDAAAASAQAAAGSAEDAQEVLESIPEDYSAMWADVADLKSSFDNYEKTVDSVIYSKTTITSPYTVTETTKIMSPNVHDYLVTGTHNKGLLYPLKQGTFEINGITIVVNKNLITITGTATADVQFSLMDGEHKTGAAIAAETYTLPDRTWYFVNGTAISGQSAIPIAVRKKDNSGTAATIQQNISTYDPTTWGGLYIYIANGSTWNKSSYLGIVADSARTYETETCERVEWIKEGYTKTDAETNDYILFDSETNAYSIALCDPISTLEARISALETTVTNHETRIVLLENIEKDRGLTKEEIVEIVTSGQAEKYFQIGEQISCTWNNGSNEYDFPWDIVAIRDVVNENDHVVPGMILQAHWLAPGVQFDSSEAIYVVPDGETLPAGTYYITMGVSWGTYVVSGKSYYFTTTQTLQAGGQILFARSGNGIYIWGAPEQDPSTWVCYTYVSNADDTPLETLTLTEGTNGTSLGSVKSTTTYSESGLNNLHRAAYGYNRYGQSAIRQWLNADAAAGAWWNPQNPFDRTPQQLASMRGFMAGLPSDFLAMINKVKITSVLSSVSGGTLSESYYDKFFLPSLEEEYCVPQASGVEGAYWPYWKDRLGLNSPQASGSANANANHARYLASNHASTATVRLRSELNGYTFVWTINGIGTVGYNNASNILASAPACVICSSE